MSRGSSSFHCHGPLAVHSSVKCVQRLLRDFRHATGFQTRKARLPHDTGNVVTEEKTALSGWAWFFLQAEVLLSVIAQQVTVNDALEMVPARSVNIEYYVLTGRIGETFWNNSHVGLQLQ